MESKTQLCHLYLGTGNLILLVLYKILTVKLHGEENCENLTPQHVYHSRSSRCPVNINNHAAPIIGVVVGSPLYYTSGSHRSTVVLIPPGC